MAIFKIFIFLNFFTFGLSYESILDNREYIKLFKLSIEYEKHKKSLEDIIEKNKFYALKVSDIKKIKLLIEKTENIINETYSHNSTNSLIKSQIYQIKFEIDEIKVIINDIMKNFSRKKNKVFIDNIYKLEYYLFRMSIYLKGISQNLSIL